MKKDEERGGGGAVDIDDTPGGGPSQWGKAFCGKTWSRRQHVFEAALLPNVSFRASDTSPKAREGRSSSGGGIFVRGRRGVVRFAVANEKEKRREKGGGKYFFAREGKNEAPEGKRKDLKREITAA